MANLWQQQAFDRGEVSPSFYGSSDTESTKGAVSKLENCVITEVGGLRKRNGLRAVHDAVSENSVLLPFVFNIVDTYVLEFSNQQMRVFRETSPNTFSVQITLEAPWEEDDLPKLSYAQNNDVLYVTHLKYKPRRIIRYSHTHWVIEDDTIPFWFSDQLPPIYSILSDGTDGRNTTKTPQGSLNDFDSSPEATFPPVKLPDEVAGQVGGIAVVPENQFGEYDNNLYFITKTTQQIWRYRYDTGVWSIVRRDNNFFAPYPDATMAGLGITGGGAAANMIGVDTDGKAKIWLTNLFSTSTFQQRGSPPLPADDPSGFHVWGTDDYAFCSDTDGKVYELASSVRGGNGTWNTGTDYPPGTNSVSAMCAKPVTDNYVVLDNSIDVLYEWDGTNWIEGLIIPSGNWTAMDTYNDDFVIYEEETNTIYNTSGLGDLTAGIITSFPSNEFTVHENGRVSDTTARLLREPTTSTRVSYWDNTLAASNRAFYYIFPRSSSSSSAQSDR